MRLFESGQGELVPSHDSVSERWSVRILKSRTTTIAAIICFIVFEALVLIQMLMFLLR